MPAKPPPRTIAENIKAARLDAHKTQLQLAHAIGHEGDDAGAYICRVESGKITPGLDTLKRIADALRVTLSDLVSTEPIYPL